MATEEDYSEEEDEITDNDKLQVAGYLICKAPSGEAKLLSHDLQTIMGKSLLSDDVVNDFLKKRGEKYYEFAKGSNAIACAQSQSGEGYINPGTGEVSTLDLRNLNGTQVADTSSGEYENNSPFRQALEAALRKRVEAHFLSEQHACRACNVFQEGETLTMVISSKNTHLGAYWTGNWQSTYQFDMQGTSINAEVKINVHYFEAGNVQLNTKKTAKIPISAISSDDAKKIVDAAMEFENELQTAISTFYTTNENNFKKVRRALTIQSTKMDWRLAIHANVATMTN